MSPLIEFKEEYADQPQAINILMVCVVTRLHPAMVFDKDDEKSYPKGGASFTIWHYIERSKRVGKSGFYDAMVLRDAVERLHSCQQFYAVSSPRSNQPEFDGLHRKIIRDLHYDFIDYPADSAQISFPVAGTLSAVPTCSIQAFKADYYEAFDHVLKAKNRFRDNSGPDWIDYDGIDARMTIAPAYRFWLETLPDYSLLRIDWV